MNIEEYLANAELFINNLPSLQKLHELWPGTPFFADPQRQLAHIAMLDTEIYLDAEEYRQFDFDYSRSNAFEGRPANVPHMSVSHWTGRHYDSPDHMADSMKSSKVSVQLYRHNDNVTYQFVDQLNTTTGHTLGVNDWAIGLEMYSGDYDGVHTPLLQFEPVGTKQSAYALLRTHHNTKMPVNMTTMLTHMGADLIFINPYYNPYTGEFNDIEGYKPKAVRKFDLPQEFMQMMGKKIIALNNALAA